jgi:hypothetical protein
VRFNDACWTMTARLPKVDYVSIRSALDARVMALVSEGETPLDERAGDALMSLMNDAQNQSGTEVNSSTSSSGSTSASQSVVVAHVPLANLIG